MCVLGEALRFDSSSLSGWEVSADPAASIRPAGFVSMTRIGSSDEGGASSSVSPAPPSPAGYEYRELIGRGGCGEVWRAVQTALQREVAVKRLHPSRSAGDAGGDQDWRRLTEAFRHEALITGRLDHPNIVPVYDLGTGGDGAPLMAMKLVRGANWDDELRRDFRQPLEKRLKRHLPVLIAVARAVAFAHSRGVIHRDLKPSQVMLGAFGEVLLMDWGLAASFCLQNAKVVLDSDFLPVPAGTPAFMAPEQARSTPDGLGPWTDLFLLGGMLYYILTATPPHPQATTAAVLESAAEGKTEPPEARSPDEEIPADLSALCMRTLAVDPAERPAGAGEFLAALEACMEGAEARRESSALARHALEALARSEGNYLALQSAENLLTTALELWPGNARAAELRDDVIRRGAELALERGDMSLAEAQARRLGDAAARPALEERIGRMQARHARQMFVRRTALRSAVVLLPLVVVLLGAFWWGSVRYARSQAERDFAARLAEGRNREQARRGELLQEVGLLRDEERRAVQELAVSPPPPRALSYAEERALPGIGMESRYVRLQEKIDAVAARRARLREAEIPLEEESSELLNGRLRLALVLADTPEKGLAAYRLAMKAARMNPSSHNARALLGVAAARADYSVSASLHLWDASGRAQKALGDEHPETILLRQFREKARLLGRESLPRGWRIVEAGAGGGRSDGPYREISGSWFDSIAVSEAPGIDLNRKGARASNIAYETTGPATARFYLPSGTPRRGYVYLTWGYAANVASAAAVVRHAGGTTTRTLTMDGWDDPDRLPFGGNGNLWVPLGSFNFNPETENWVEIRADRVTTHIVRHGYQHRLYADAVLITPEPLRQGWSDAPLRGSASVENW